MDWAEPRPHAASEGDPGSIKVLGWEEGRELLDRRARCHLGISGEEFLRRWHAGFYGDEPEEIEVAYVSMLLPYVS